MALARAKLNATATSARLQNFEVLRQPPRQVAVSPDGQYFLTVGDRQRFTPAQDPNQPERLALDGKPAPGNPNFGKTGAATIPPSRQDCEAGEHLYLCQPQPDAG